ncbi:putative Nephrin [Hypsibius exemplaris]|uniref:Nephrin n=1 Tax=Hypsibius exemplaris TaxID=2072580 RepID=A0A1W0XE59_HYPEX|nr:putative Nephrin [Hypsibius exemplaris]
MMDQRSNCSSSSPIFPSYPAAAGSYFPTQRFVPLVLMIINDPCFVSSAVIHLIQAQQLPAQQPQLKGSEDTFVEPFGQVTLQCLIPPGELPRLRPGGPVPWFIWKVRRTGSVTEDSPITLFYKGQLGNQQPDVMSVVGDLDRGEFNLLISNVTYDSHDGDYTCEVNFPGQPPLKSKTFHLYVKYQPQSPQVDFSLSPTDLREEQKLTMSCSSRDGNPPPQITWLRNGTPVRNGVVYTQAKNRRDLTKAELTLDPLRKEDDRALFSCRVENAAVSHPLIKMLDPLNVKYKPRVTVAGYIGSSGPLTALALEAGTEARLTCNVDSNPPVAAPSWRKDGQQFQAGAFNYTFTPGALTRDSRGSYACVATNGVGGEQAAEIKVDVFFAPVVTVQPEAIALREGESGTLHCRVESNPPYDVVEWFNVNGERLSQTLELKIGQVKRSEAGNYECRASVRFAGPGGQQVTRVGRAAGRVDVKYKPGNAVIEPAAPVAVFSSRVSMRCSVSDPGLPPASFRWRKLGGENYHRSLVNTGEYYNITATELNDNGDYECTPFNDVGEGVPKVVRLEVNEPVSWTNENLVETNLVRKIADKPFGLACSARGRPAPRFVWKKDGVEIPQSDKLYNAVTAEPAIVDRLAFVTRSELRFEGSARTELFSSNNTLQRTDRGRYVCEARNEVGQPIARETRVMMQYPPAFTSPINKVATDPSPSSPTKIDCIVESNPAPTFSWSRNGQPLLSYNGSPRVGPAEPLTEETFRSSLTLDPATDGDLGEYTCTATNLIGDNTKKFSLVRPTIPDEPRNLKQKDLDYNAVTLQWDGGFDGGFPQRFTVLMTSTERSTPQEFPVIPADATEFRVTGLSPLVAYTFRVRAQNQMGMSRATSETMEVTTLKKPILAEDIPRPTALKYDPKSGVVTFSSPDGVKDLNLCALIEVRHANEDTFTPATACLPFRNNAGAYTITRPNREDYHARLRFCVTDKPDVCGQAVDEQSVLLQASTLQAARLDIILPIVIIVSVVVFGCLITCVVCRRRARRTPVKTAKASNLTLTTHNGSVESGATGGFYSSGSEYANQALQENGSHGIYATHNSKLPQYGNALPIESQYGNGLYAQVDRKLNGDLSRDGNSPYKNQMTDLNGSTLYSSGNMYMQTSYPSYDDGYGHQHSPLESNYAHLPVEVNGLPDPYEEYEKTPSFGEESVESGYSTSNSRGRRVIREIIV